MKQTRLEFKSQNGTAVPVAGLSTPITFTLPASSAVGGGAATQAACSFWDTATQTYSSAGCVTAPNPLPPGVVAGFVAGASVSGALGLPAVVQMNVTVVTPLPATGATSVLYSNVTGLYYTCASATSCAQFTPPTPAWVAPFNPGFAVNASNTSQLLSTSALFSSGGAWGLAPAGANTSALSAAPLLFDAATGLLYEPTNGSVFNTSTVSVMAPGGGCGEVFLNCSDPAQINKTIFPDPAQPLAVPAVSCGGALSARVLRVVTGGASCPLTSNASGCAWNQTSQAFSGPGCVAAPQTDCACLHLTDFASQARARTTHVTSAAPAHASSPARCGRRGRARPRSASAARRT